MVEDLGGLVCVLQVARRSVRRRSLQAWRGDLVLVHADGAFLFIVGGFGGDVGTAAVRHNDEDDDFA